MVNVDSISEVIRTCWETLPDREPLEHEFALVEKDDLCITNEMYKCPGLRKIHLEVAKTGKLDILHCVFFPDPAYNLPIFGCDIVATPSVITAAIVDVSPVRGVKRIYDEISKVSNRYTFSDKRPLPLWGDEVFSPFCKFLRIKSETEGEHYYEILMEYLMIFCRNVNNTVRDDNWVKEMLRLDDQIWYCKQQKTNKKLIAVLSNWFDKDWAEYYIDTILFDEPNAKNKMVSTSST